jgi:hypothetical protein
MENILQVLTESELAELMIRLLNSWNAISKIRPQYQGTSLTRFDSLAIENCDLRGDVSHCLYNR